jgi:hypothetical protein
VKTITKLMTAAVTASALLALGHMAVAQEKKKTEPAAKSKCNAITDEKACRADTTCVWIKASIDPTTNKEKRKAHCRTKSSPKKKDPAKK